MGTRRDFIRTSAGVGVGAAFGAMGAAPARLSGAPYVVIRRVTPVCVASGNGLGAVARHGDLWHGNLLADGDVLTGIIDWDAFAPAATPAADLLELLVTPARKAVDESLGEAVVQRPWQGDPFRARATALLEKAGADDVGSAAEAAGLAWWAAEAANSLTRMPELASNGKGWVSRNVTNVLDVFA